MKMETPAQPRTPWKELLLYFFGSRALVALIGWLSPLVLPQGQFDNHPVTLLGRFLRWDATWFLDIARHGYHYAPPAQSSLAFFPLYPLLIRGLGWIVGRQDIAGYLIANVALFGAIVLLWTLAENEAAQSGGGPTPGDGSRSVRLLLFGPVSFFFSILYSEALFLFLMLACFYAARRQCWILAGVAGLGAALTRNAGLFLTAPLLVEYFGLTVRAPHFRRPVSIRRCWPCFLPALGIGLWSAFLLVRFGDPLLFLNVQSAWGRQLTWPWFSFESQQLQFPPFYVWWFVGHAVVGIGLFFVACYARLRPSYLLLAALLLLLNLSATHLEAIPRLLSVIFPLYLGAAVLLRRTPALEFVVLGLSAGLLTLSTILFANGYWFT